MVWQKSSRLLHFSGFYSHFNEMIQPNHSWNLEYSSNMRGFKVNRTYPQKFITIALADRPVQMFQKFVVWHKSSRLMHYSEFDSHFNEIVQPNHSWNLDYSSNMRRFKEYRTYIKKFITIALANRPAQM